MITVPTTRQRNQLKQFINTHYYEVTDMNDLTTEATDLDRIARINYYQTLVYEVNCLSLPSTRKAAAAELSTWMLGVVLHIDAASYISLSVIGDGLLIDPSYTVTTTN